MIKALIVGCGGFIGSILRYLSYLFVVKIVSQSYVVYGTIFVNLLGCFIIGILAGLYEGHHLTNDNLRLFLMIGILGGFTTFSTFGLENYVLIKKTQILYAVLNVVIQVSFGIIGAWLGFQLTKNI